MLQTIEAIMDTNGRVRLLETVKVSKKRRVLVTILPEESPLAEKSIVGSIELLDEDLDEGSAIISARFHQALQDSARELAT